MKIIVVGGCGGLGRAIIRSLQKHEVINASQNVVEGVTNIPLDLTNNESILSFINEVQENHSDLDCLIHSAGLYQSDESLNISFEEIDRLFLVNTTGVIKTTNKLLGLLEKNKGLVVVIGSINIKKRNHLVYTPSKCALQAYVEYLQEQQNVRITMCNPGLINTELFENAGAKRDKSDAMRPEDVAQVIKQVVENTTVEISEIIVKK